MSLRAYRSGDLAQLLNVWYRASRIAHPFLTKEFLGNERTAIAERWIPMAETTVFERDGRVVGFLSLIGNEVGAVFVDPDYQRRGIGRTLMDDARSKREYLELAVFDANPIGRSFYDSCGFRLLERRRNEETGHPELRLRLDPATPGDV